MITGDGQRFHELVHNALDGRAKTAEEAELKALLARNPALHNEFEQLKAAAAAAREILPLLEHLEPPGGHIPPPPIERLKTEVGNVLAGKSSEPLEQLLSRLEQWARQQAAESRDIVMNLIATVRQCTRSWKWWAGYTFGSGHMVAGFCEEQMDRLYAEPSVFERLSHLEKRLTASGQITPQCRQEIEALIQAFKRPGG